MSVTGKGQVLGCLVLFALAALLRGDEVDFSNCDHDNFDYPVGEVTSVKLTGCDEFECIIKSGSVNTAQVEFVPEFDHDEVVTSIVTDTWYAKTLIDRESVCGEFMKCPVAAGETAHFVHKRIQVDIPWFIPFDVLKDIPINVTISDKETHRTIACFNFNISIEEKVKEVEEVEESNEEEEESEDE